MKDEQPPDFPPMTLTAMRALSVVAATAGNDNGNHVHASPQQERLASALDALYTAFWVRHVPVHQPNTLASILAEVLGEDEAKSVMEKSNTEGKALLLQNTDFAFQKGAFGLPWLSCTNSDGEEQGFWGVDHLGQVTQFLGLEKPASSKGWKAVL
ncbi:thioredoxin-like protein [Zalerion maritima]|uniref:Thioredoxin-like protein n=1 Tax=Zalerion maritima TaxID=339359 RepID=A0AAD5RPF0_9PEZI|nr:thioredoxin-like protein [Zalerion maritima]